MRYLCGVKNVLLITITIIMLTKPMWPVLDYMANYDYIVNTLCENRDKPELECNGKCHLTKELAKEAGADDTNPQNKTSNTEIPQIIISEHIQEYVFVSESCITSSEKTGYKPNLNSFLFSSEILHPPQFV